MTLSIPVSTALCSQTIHHLSPAKREHKVSSSVFHRQRSPCHVRFKEALHNLYLQILRFFRAIPNKFRRKKVSPKPPEPAKPEPIKTEPITKKETPPIIPTSPPIIPKNSDNPLIDPKPDNDTGKKLDDHLKLHNDVPPPPPSNPITQPKKDQPDPNSSNSDGSKKTFIF